MSKYEVTRHCVRNAIKSLVDIGYVYTVQGSGTFIRENNREGCLRVSDIKGLYAEFGEENIETKLVRFNIVEADEKFSEIMKCKIGTPIYDCVRLRIVKGISCFFR